jgi:hypothetical protein
VKILFWLCFVLPLIFCSGCIAIPYHFTERPGVAGVVVDRRTEIPLANVRINLASVYGIWNPTNHLSVWRTNQLVSTYSTTNGIFKISPKKEWGLLIIPSDVFPRGYELKTESTNYQPLAIRFTYSPMHNGKYAVTNFGIIKLSAE